MKKIILLASALGLAVAASSSMAASFGDMGKLLSGDKNKTSNGTAATTGALLNALTGQLNVSLQQAAGGTAALLALAKNQLGNSDYASLTKSVPGLDQLTGANALSSLGALGNAGSALGALTGKKSDSGSGQLASMLGNVGSMQDVGSVFSSLGMNSDLITQFAPILLSFLGSQGTSNGLLQSLSGIWGASGN